MASVPAQKRAPLASSSSPAPAPASITHSSPSPSPPLFMCCVSLPGPLQPLSLPSSSPSPPSSSSPSSSSSSSADLPSSRDSLPTLSEIACLERRKACPSVSHSHVQRNHVAELLLFRGRRKLGMHHHQPQSQQRLQQQNKDTSSQRNEQEVHKNHRFHGNILDLATHAQKRRSSKADDVRKSWELLKSGEVSSLIKQGFMERTQRRLSPGRVSPLVHENLAPSTNNTISPLYTTSRKLTPGHQPNPHAPLATSPPPEKPAKSNTLFDMMSKDAEARAKPKTTAATCIPSLQRSRSSGATINAGISRNPLFNNVDGSDVKLSLKGIDGEEVCLNLHSHILVEHSKYFAARLTETWCKQQQQGPCLLQIEDCEDLEVYQETLHLLYCQDLQPRLVRCNVSRVLAILKVAALILFESCIVCCLEYLEAAPWAEEEEAKVRSFLGRLQLGSVAAANVLKRITNDEESSSGVEDTLARLIQMVIKGKDNKARREMKALVSKMLRENVSQNSDRIDLSKESLYQACTACLDTLSVLFLQASRTDFMTQGSEDRGTLIAQIAHQADNLMWLLEILLDRHIANDFVKMWAHQSELANVHKRIATVLRFEVSRLTARLCVAIGRGQRCCKGLDKNVVEEGISQTILTLSLKQQQSILLSWFDRFSNNGDDCPNLQRAFEVWWRRTFVRPCTDD